MSWVVHRQEIVCAWDGTPAPVPVSTLDYRVDTLGSLTEWPVLLWLLLTVLKRVYLPKLSVRHGDRVLSAVNSAFRYSLLSEGCGGVVPGYPTKVRLSSPSDSHALRPFPCFLFCPYQLDTRATVPLSPRDEYGRTGRTPLKPSTAVHSELALSVSLVSSDALTG